MDIEILHDLKYELFIFPIRSKFLGITLFGGTVLLNSSLFDRDEDLSRCFQKITFVHEIAHLIRRRSNNGFYDAKIKTPNVSGMLTPGSPGYINANEAMMCDEGGQQLERELFGFYVTEVNMNHIKYINKNANWNKELPDFKDGLANMFDETLFTYHYCRAEDLLYRIDRLSHSEA
ncbi:unnamed protein product [Blepharisma stoltei]|uniref:IrrE N-terminal-like domain-containing protein n=1 Tax=Blepharisma stoltei TaxID=1481888 RepID=A0AAU9IQH2_9CILI|nr:unnamed protein product [Blepharisma stoltei]